MTSSRSLAPLLFTIVFAVPCGADEVIPIKDLPKAVMTTVTNRYPKGELAAARKFLEGRAIIYEIDLSNDKSLIEIAIFADGVIDWVAVDLPIADLPKPVLAGVRKKYPAAMLNDASTVYTVKNGKDHLEHYHVELATKDGKKRALDVLPSGIIEEDEELDE